MIVPHEQHDLEQVGSGDSFDENFLHTSNLLRTDKSFSIKEFYIFNNTELINKKGQKFNRTAFSTLLTGSVYTSAITDYLIGVTSLSYAPSIGLPRPSLVGAGKTYIVKDEAGGAATTTITVRSAGEETIDGASTATITTNYQAKSFYTDGANWFIY